MSENVVVLIAKVPCPGFSKTRLIPDVGKESAAAISRCLLLDTLTNMLELEQRTSSRLVWFFAPQSLRTEAEAILQEINAPHNWVLEPMPSFESLSSPNLGSYLKYALVNLTGEHW
jgi:glycosyltransferase A (GT-A) superfamily protein (DUF2064 family)